jgi:hypothetical protein
MDELVLELHVLPGPKAPRDYRKEVLRSLDATFEKTQCTHSLDLGQ